MPASNVQWAVPLIRQNPWFPGQMGVEGGWTETGLHTHCTGSVFYVDPNYPGASDGRDGTDPTDPLLSVTGAVARCGDYQGDTIVVMQNSTWTYAPQTPFPTGIAEHVILNKAGVRLVGLSPSSLGVPWVPTANSGTCLTITAMDVTVEGFCFWNSGAYITTTGILVAWNAPTLYGESCVMRNNFFYGLAYGIQADYSWNNYIEHNSFQGISTAAIHNPSVYGEPDYLTIRNNMFVSNAADINLPDTDDCLIENNRFMDVTAAIVMLNGDQNTIHGNTIQGDPTGTNNYVNLTVGASNLVSQNVLGCTIAQYDVVASDATSGSWVGNLCTNGTATAPPI